MKSAPLSRRLLTAAVLAAASTAASANVSLSSLDRGSFESLGSVAFSYGFEDVALTSGRSYQANPWTTHGVTYDTGFNMVVGPGFGSFGLTNKMFSSNSSNPGGLVSGAISGAGYDLFAFDLGTLLGNSTANISLTTNLGTYSFANMAVPRGPATAFFGFRADSGEYFTRFSISDAVNGTIPLLDNVTLAAAIASPVPEPDATGLLAAGLLILGAGFRRRARS